MTDTSAVVTWETDEAVVGSVAYGVPEQSRVMVGEDAPAGRFHVVELAGLEPETAYGFTCQLGMEGVTIDSGEERSFTTLATPPGRELFTFATITDLHIGQDEVGHIRVGPRLEARGLRWPDASIPFWQITASGAVAAINAREAAFTIVKGDVTHEWDPRQMASAMELLGGLDAPVWLVRGNHDDGKNVRDVTRRRTTWYSFDHEGVHFVVLDTEPLRRGGDARQRSAQFGWLEKDLKDHAGMWTYVYVHRPIPPDRPAQTGPVAEAAFLAQRRMLARSAGEEAMRLFERLHGRFAYVDEGHAWRLVKMLERHGHVAGVFAGHSHRMWRGTWAEAGGTLPFVETAALREYPCAYTLVRVHEGGYLQASYPVPDRRCRRWAAMTRDHYAALGWGHQAGRLEDRCFAVRYEAIELSGRPAARAGVE